MIDVDRDTLRGVRDAVLEQHRQRLEQAEPPVWLTQRAEQVVQLLLDTGVADLVDPKRLKDGLLTGLDVARVRESAIPAMRFVMREASGRLVSREASLAEVLGPEALGALNELLARPDVVDEALLADLARDDALEQLMQDVLFDALKEFSERVNPFVAEWGLPALLDQLPLFGKGTLRKAFEGMRGDFDRRLEPEIRKFLKTFARKSVERMIELTLRNSAEPAHVAMRQQLARTVLERPLGELCWPPDDARLSLAIRIAEGAMVSGASHALTRALLDETIDELWQRWQQSTVREVLEELAAEPPPVAPFVEAAWPLIRTVLLSAPVLAELGALLDEAHEAWLAGQQ